MTETFERQSESPRRVRQGIKVKANQDPGTVSWPGQRWRAVLEAIMPAPELSAGMEYARLGQTTALELSSGLIEARVQGRAAVAYVTRFRMPVLSEQQWQRLIDAMAGEAFYAAKLLTRELPPEVDSLLGSLDVRLFPQASEVAAECDCAATGPCKHAAAVGYLVAQRLDDDPLAVFTLRGMPSEQALARLGAARARRTRGVSAAHAEPVSPPGEAEPLESCLDSFWRPGPQLGELQQMPPPHHAPHALLRRLGPSPWPGGFPLVGLLASVYDTVTEATVRLRDEAERLGDS